MNISEINEIYAKTVKALDSGKIYAALQYLRSLINIRPDDYQLNDRLTSMHDTYIYMLRYRLDGINDPMQETIRLGLLTDAYRLLDETRHKILANQSSSDYYIKRAQYAPTDASAFNVLHKALQKSVDDWNLTGDHLPLENLSKELFYRIWTAENFNADETESIRGILRDVQLPTSMNCHIVAALTLSLEESFNLSKLGLLFDAAASEENNTRIRALIGILITLYLYRNRTKLYPDIASRLATLSEQFKSFTVSVRTIILRFILSRETEEITRELQQEVIPEMMKMTKFNQKMNLKDMTSGDSTSEMNPEWEDLLAGSSLGKKMEKLSELQEEGADVMHSTFTHLKNFPFFMELSNWFLPFNMNHSVLNNASQGDNKDILSILSNAIFLCNSDKYSLFLSIMMLPENMRQMMSQQVSGDSAQLVEQSHEELISKRGPVEIIASQYIQDLYRFHKLYQRRYDFLDIFSQTLDFHNLEILQPYISDRESLTIIAEFYLRKNYFRDALTVYDKLSVTYDDNQLLQKKGYCEQMLEDYDHALQTYLKAGLTDTNSLWLLRHIAVCYRMLKQPKEALDYYMRCEQFAPDNLSIQINIGNCLLSMKEYTEALKYYFKVDYLDSKNHRAWRPIAWCSFITGKYDQAQNYYKKILAEKPEAQDYLNAGHTEWALRNLHAAVSDYAEAARNCGDGYPEFEKLFLQDLPELKAAGIHENDVQLMLDSVSFSLSGTL